MLPAKNHSLIMANAFGISTLLKKELQNEESLLVVQMGLVGTTIFIRFLSSMENSLFGDLQVDQR